MFKKIETTKKDILWNYTGTIFSMASNFLILPLIFHFLTKSEIGYWYLLLSINGLTTLLDFGFDPAFARNIAYVWSGITSLKRKGIEESGGKQIDLELFSNIIHTARVVYLIISLCAVVLIGTFGTIYMIKVVFSTLSGLGYQIAWLIFVFSIFLNLYFGYFSALLRGSGKVEYVNKAQVFSRLLQILFIIVGFSFYSTILVPVIGLVIYGLFFRLFCNRYFWNDSFIKFNKKVLKKRASFKTIKVIFGIIWPNTWRDGLVSFSNYFTTQGMTIMAGIFLPLSLTGTYAIGIQFASALGTAASAINGAIHPALQALFVKRDLNEIRKKTANALAIYVWTFWLGALLTTYAIFPLLRIIRAESVPENGMFFLMLVYYFLYQFHTTHASYIANANIIPYTRGFVMSAIINIVVLWALLRLSGGNIYVLLLVPIIIQGAYNNWYWPRYYYSMINASLWQLLDMGTRNLIGHFKIKKIN